MRNLRADAAKAFGILGLLGITVAAIAASMISWDQPLLVLLLTIAAIVPFTALAWYGLGARSIFIDGDELLTENESGDYSRMPISSVVSARTVPLPFGLGILTFQPKSGPTIMTVVRGEDLLWIMSKMPDPAITPYWRRRIG